MATTVDSAFNASVLEWREKAILLIMNKSFKMDWCEAEKLTDDYKEYCKPYWKDYDTHFNGKFNKCGFCMKMKRALVRSKWSCSENYPLRGQLTCVNTNCKFYLIINSDLEEEY